MAGHKVLLKLYVWPRWSAHCYEESSTIIQSQSKLSDRRLVRIGTKTVWMLTACFSFSSPVLCVHVST